MKRKSKLKQLARILYREYVAVSKVISEREFMNAIIYHISIQYIQDIKMNVDDKDGISYLSRNIDRLSIKFPLFKKSYDYVISKRSNIPWSDYNQIVREIYLDEKIDINEILSWLFQYFKREKQRIIYSNSLREGLKIEGEDILVVTQFFTDEYMVEYLTQNTLNEIDPLKINLKSIRVFDPACGSGNFLIKAFEYLFELYGDYYDQNELVNDLLSYVLIGYDLDKDIASIAKLNLFLKASNFGEIYEKSKLQVFGGFEGDRLGFLKYDISNYYNLIMNETNSTNIVNLKDIIKEDNFLYILTNPPFMGNRDMGKELNDYLKEKYPLSKGDLCVAFMIRCINSLSKGDKLGLVNQTSWMFLKNFKEIRKLILENFQINECIDLGSNSFEDISGEKTNIALTIIEKNDTLEKSAFYHLRTFSINEKKYLLKSNQVPQKDIFYIDQRNFLRNRDYEMLYLLEGSLKNKFEYYERYGDFAIPMQGTSTGKNPLFIDYSWNKSDDPDWKLVSKGGGYSKWIGLNHFKIKWGSNAEYILANKGSAIRNLDKIPQTELVYSDTGTLGLNARILKKNQVFIASGPGIILKRGDKYSHLAFLNSRVASFFIRIISPKLTISAGYIKNIPVKDEILNSKSISSLSKECLKLKETYLKKKISNEEFYNTLSKIKYIDHYLEKNILEDLSLELDRLKNEYEIEKEIEKLFEFNPEEKLLIRQIVGNNPFENKETSTIPNLDFDVLLSKSLNVNCQYSKGKIKRASIGCEGFLEEISIAYNLHPMKIFDLLKNNLSKMNLTKQKYREDLYHKLLLSSVGFKSNSNMELKELDYNEIVNFAKQILEEKGEINRFLFWIHNGFESHHHKSFYYSGPLLNKKEKQKVVPRG